MSERKKLNLEINTPKEITLLYSEPIIGSNQYGEYFMYAVKSGNEEYAFFAPVEVHQELQNYGKGDSFSIVKLAAQRGQKLITKYAIEPRKNGHSVPAAETKEVKTFQNEIPSLPDEDKHYKRMLQSYRDSLDLQDELGIPIDVGRIAISIYISRCK